MDSVASGTPYTLQQDSAPAHTAKLVQSWLKKNVPNFWDFNTLPPNSPDLNHATTTCRGSWRGMCTPNTTATLCP
ncbi:Transposable element tcb1 transposase [Caligus rogercresseyi]|uniref:Transposable element tcb1 transposase n=1 Tax=Caligus rogercresseyi TaxID=217165 RepID=A0A7T8QU77_CALRO|nr:Transposable element tcb1 transposase [Caligus rogercresseyi]